MEVCKDVLLSSLSQEDDTRSFDTTRSHSILRREFDPFIQIFNDDENESCANIYYFTGLSAIALLSNYSAFREGQDFIFKASLTGISSSITSQKYC
jgi:hypothetical protein